MSVPFLAAPSLPVYITSQGNITKSIGFFSHQKAPPMLRVGEGEGSHTFNASTWETGRWISGFETSLVYKVRSRTARTIHKSQSQKKKVPLRAETLFRLIDICETNKCILTQVDSKDQVYFSSIKQWFQMRNWAGVVARWLSTFLACVEAWLLPQCWKQETTCCELLQELGPFVSTVFLLFIVPDASLKLCLSQSWTMILLEESDPSLCWICALTWFEVIIAA